MVVGTMTQTTRNPELTSNVPLADTLQVDSAEAILASSDSLAAQDTLLLAATDSLVAPPATLAAALPQRIPIQPAPRDSAAETEDVVIRHVTVVREPLVIRENDSTQQKE
ncbi:MAG TPA: hypothetical protein DCR93_38515 [Cytophagales bacterium]|nr:hypothetical protein [Cytophagales bacterium]